MSRRQRLLGVGLLATLLFLLVRMPASWLLPPLAGLLPGLGLERISGTPWSGRVALLRLGDWEVGPARWSLLWRPWIRGEILLEGSLGRDGSLRGEGRAGIDLIGALLLDGVRGGFPLRDLSRLTPLVPTGLEGEVAGEIRRLEVTSRGFRRLTGEATLSGLTLGPPLSLALGSFRITLSDEAGEAMVRMADLASPLDLDATLAINLDGRYRLEGAIGSREQGDNRLASLLRMAGQAGADGRIPLRLEGSLALPVP
ncbi:MAG: type II secretion system protein N [Magnetococcales bacterium]|nr:type II secretion system protein N [Magnetococcales bacterium]MBF0156526.1 type II secretion system protein N [Magnetococcales bacterium]